jgi:hypothetical protein
MPRLSGYVVNRVHYEYDDNHYEEVGSDALSIFSSKEEAIDFVKEELDKDEDVIRIIFSREQSDLNVLRDIILPYKKKKGQEDTETDIFVESNKLPFYSMKFGRNTNYYLDWKNLGSISKNGSNSELRNFLIEVMWPVVFKIQEIE